MISRRSVRGFVVAALLSGLVAFAASCQKREAPATTTSVTTSLDSTTMANLDPGQQAYLTHCAMCHGQWGGGDGPLAQQLFTEAKIRPAALNDGARMSLLSRAEVIKVIEKGGAHTGRSNLMPPWSGKIDHALIGRIADFVKMLPDLKPTTPPEVVESFLKAPPGSAPEGRRLFVFYCAMCHGPEGHGDGQLADTLWVRNRIRPRNLTDSSYVATMTDQQLFATVSLGGAHFHKSAYMPMWNVTLTPEQIKSLVSYIRTISRTTTAPAP